MCHGAWGQITFNNTDTEATKSGGCKNDLKAISSQPVI